MMYRVIIDTLRRLAVAAGLFWISVVADAQLIDFFAPAPNWHVSCLAVQADGNILVGGQFTSIAGQSRAGIARLTVDGTCDPGFDPGIAGGYQTVECLGIQADGKILLGGDFTSVGGQPRTNIARLNPDGSVDLEFNPGADSLVSCLAVQADGKILIGGYFNHLCGQARYCLGRLNSDGSLDIDFNTGASYYVLTLAQQADGKILVGGVFDRLGGVPRRFLGRLNEDGTVDDSFGSAMLGGVPMSWVACLAPQPDGSVLVGGHFVTTSSPACTNLARVRASGSLDLDFQVSATEAPAYSQASVFSFGAQADGKALVGGTFLSFTGTGLRNLGRLEAAGTPDDSFDLGQGSPDAEVYSIALQRDGKALVGGGFTRVDGFDRLRLARLVNPEPAEGSLLYSNATINWVTGGSLPEPWRVTFEQSTNNLDWLRLGNGVRTNSGWWLSGVSVPHGSTIRALGQIVSGPSCWVLEARCMAYTIATIVLDTEQASGRSGPFGFNIVGPAGQRVVVETSADLSAWLPVATNTFGYDKLFFSDAESGGANAKFYRLVSPGLLNRLDN